MCSVQVGTVQGIWHGHPVSFSIQQKFPTTPAGDTPFNGVATFTGGPHSGIQFGFTGFLESSGRLTMSRVVGIGVQTASAFNPQVLGNQCAWQGNTTGVGIDGALPFSITL